MPSRKYTLKYRITMTFLYLLALAIAVGLVGQFRH